MLQTAEANVEVFQRLIGRWQLARTIGGSETSCGPKTMSGQALVTRVGPDRLDYREWGQASHPNQSQPIEFHKGYIFCLAGGAIELTHAERWASERKFHSLRFRPRPEAIRPDAIRPEAVVQTEDNQGQAFGSVLVARGDHICGADRYLSEYEVAANTWSTRHVVTGPRKNYCTKTTYTRAAVSAAGALPPVGDPLQHNV